MPTQYDPGAGRASGVDQDIADPLHLVGGEP